MDKLLDIRELAELTGLSVLTIYKRQGGTNTLPRLKFGKKLMWRMSDVEKWINSRVEQPREIRMIPNIRRLLPTRKRLRTGTK